MPDRPITVIPGIRFGAPAIAGISVHAVADAYTAEGDVDTVAADYDLTRSEVLTALWFEGMHGERPGWRDWAVKVAYPVLSKPDEAGDVDALEPPDPALGGEDKTDVVHADGRHYYWSTHCRHGHHGSCRFVCKHCPAPCICPCH